MLSGECLVCLSIVWVAVWAGDILLWVVTVADGP